MLATILSASSPLLFTNFGPAQQYNQTSAYLADGPSSCLTPEALAAQFSPAASEPFADARLALALFSGTNQLSVYLESDASGFPGTILEQINVTGLVAFPGSVITANSVIHTPLVKGTPYWLVVVATGTTCAGWFLNSTGDNSTASNFAFNVTASPTGPWTYELPGNARPAFEIDGVLPATTLTPAPSSPDATGTNPESVAVADFNMDGNPDVATANLGGDVSILLGNGDGTFQPEVKYSAGAGPRAIAVGDFNGDGCPDLVVVNSYAGISILLNIKSGSTCTGTFNIPVSYTAGSTPEAVAVQDFNNDGILDLAVTNNGDNTVSVFLGIKGGTFQSPLTYPVGVGPSGIAAADFNRDGNQDLAVVNSGAGTVSILLGNGAVGGTLTFTPYSIISAGRTLNLGQVIVTTDFNHDSYLDLAIAADVGVIVALGNGNGSFQSPVTYPADNNPDALAVGDFNGDGNPDLAVTNAYSNDVSVLLGNGDGTFKPPVDYVVSTLPTSVAVGDFNNDDRPDLAITNFDDNDIAVLLGTVWNITTCAAIPCTLPAPPQAATVNNAFPLPLVVQVTDILNAAVPGATVTFSAPTTAPSATLSPSTPVTTNGSGVAQVTATADSVPGGPYLVTAMVGFGGVATFTLTNSPGNPTIATAGGTPQTTIVNTSFSTPLQAKVIDAAGNLTTAVVPVTFVAPSGTNAPSGTFAGGVTTVTVNTVNGIATAPTFTANGIAGFYSVTATAGSGVLGVATFSLTNLGIPAAITAYQGTSQSNAINATFTSLEARVTDANGNPVAGVMVTFTVIPAANGAGGTFTGSVTTATVTTGSTGLATAPAFTANGTAGTYSVSASLPAYPNVPVASFTLTNVSGSGFILPTVTVQAGNWALFPLQLGVPPASTLLATVTSSNASVLSFNLLNPVSQTVVEFLAGSTTPNITPKVYGLSPGTVTITVSAYGYASVIQTVIVTP